MKIGARRKNDSQKVSSPIMTRKKAQARRYGPRTLLMLEKIRSGFNPATLSARLTVRKAIGTQNKPSNRTATPTIGAAGATKIMTATPGPAQTNQIVAQRRQGTTTSSQKPVISGQPGGLSSPLHEATM